MSTLASTRRPAASTTSARLTCIAAAVVACGLAYGLSRFTGWLGESVVMPVGAPILVIAGVMSVFARGIVGLHWGTTSHEWRAVTGSIAALAVVTAGFRLIGSSAPYESSLGEFVLVPVGEELMFRGLLLGALLMFLQHRGLETRAKTWAVVISALAFGVGHLGNLGYVDTAFVVLQVFVATAFGLLAGWLRVRTDSLAAPVLLHTTMNVLAVV